MGVGFIRDKLEIKFLILYIAARVSEPLPLEQNLTCFCSIKIPPRPSSCTEESSSVFLLPF